ncbi:MAG TPA: prepilin-type N-terminal cleavage/methylation domain-containing protein [Phycisphaerae bacterium]|jgi:prepilin-type N-terminal cleavage/methylation domain-containing protein|nr:prepilin-type N-terminal cleavage/methylation domain-containing protein [Phycisphaerae bacterium]
MSLLATQRRRRAFTAMELMIVITILSIVSVISIDTIATFEANQRADRASREALAFFRFARNLAMTTGKTAEVRLTPASSTFAVYWMSNGTSYDATPYPQSMVAGGQMLINMTTERELQGTTLSATGGATDFAYGPLGSCSTSATITFTYGHSTKTLVIPQVGDPQIQ